MHAAVMLAFAIAATQQPSAPQIDRTTMAGSATFTYNGVKGFILRSAEKMPVEQFNFQPTPEVRSFGQVLAHIADANYLLCSPGSESRTRTGRGRASRTRNWRGRRSSQS